MIQIVYRGECDYTGNYWMLYEVRRAWLFYDNEEFYLRVEHGKKFPEYEGHIAVIGYHCWEDLLKDWWVPRIVKAESWMDPGPDKHFEGNTIMDEIIGVSRNFHQTFIEGWNNNERKSQLV